MKGNNDEVKKASEFERRRIISLAILHFGRPAADRLLEAVAALDDKPKDQKEKKMHPFLEKVGLYELENKSSRAEAIKAVAVVDPGLHQDYISSVQPKGRSEIDPAVKNISFEAEVKKYKTKHKCSQGEAIKAVSSVFPALHDDYVARLKNGTAEALR